MGAAGRAGYRIDRNRPYPPTSPILHIPYSFLISINSPSYPILSILATHPIHSSVSTFYCFNSIYTFYTSLYYDIPARFQGRPAPTPPQRPTGVGKPTPSPFALTCRRPFKGIVDSALPVALSGPPANPRLSNLRFSLWEGFTIALIFRKAVISFDVAPDVWVLPERDDAGEKNNEMRAKHYKHP